MIPIGECGLLTRRNAMLARRFCHALAEETAGMNPGSGRMVQPMAQRMGITFDEASVIADDCARRDWVDHRQHTVSSRGRPPRRRRSAQGYRD